MNKNATASYEVKQAEKCYKSEYLEACSQAKACFCRIFRSCLANAEAKHSENKVLKEMFVIIQKVINWALLSVK
jgi:hypothetical protein